MRPLAVFLVLIVFAGCDSDGVTPRLKKVNFDSNLFSGGPEYVLNFFYDSEGRVIKIINASLTAPTVSNTVIAYSEDKIIIQRENSIATVLLEGGMIKQYAVDLTFMSEHDRDTLDFSYTEGRLSQIVQSSNNRTYSVETDASGNITRMVSGETDLKFKYDDRPNPFKGVWVSGFSLVSGSQTRLLGRNIATFFSPNNNGFPYDGNAEYSYGINGYPARIDSKNLYRDRAELVYEYIED